MLWYVGFCRIIFSLEYNPLTYTTTFTFTVHYSSIMYSEKDAQKWVFIHCAAEVLIMACNVLFYSMSWCLVIVFPAKVRSSVVLVNPVYTVLPPAMVKHRFVSVNNCKLFIECRLLQYDIINTIKYVVQVCFKSWQDTET